MLASGMGRWIRVRRISANGHWWSFSASIGGVGQSASSGPMVFGRKKEIETA
ncbi:hypothetical protein [Azospirillum doebereinerae]